MKTKYLLSLVIVCGPLALADDITTLDGHKYEDVRDVTVKHNGLFFVSGSGDTMKGVTVPFSNLPDDLKQKYHYDPYEAGLMFARQNQTVYLNKNLAFSLDNLEAAKKKAKAEKDARVYHGMGCHVRRRRSNGWQRQQQLSGTLLFRLQGQPGIGVRAA